MTQTEAEETGEPAAKKSRLSDEEYQVLRKKLKDRKKLLTVCWRVSSSWYFSYHVLFLFPLAISSIQTG